MCGTCGCGESDARVELLAGLHGQALEPVPDHGHDHGHDHEHEHDHEHDHGHDHEHGAGVIEIETALLAKNDHLAEHNRAWLAQHGVLAVNLMSSPGSGKTSLLARTITELSGTRTVGVIEGDQETRIDAEKIRAAGAPVVQINTGSGCHLDAAMLARGLRQLAPPSGSLVFVENVGNLVCPALFDLGEAARVVVVSVTEGEDKPLKYPYMFSVADLVVINKVDLLPYVDVQLDRLVGHCRSVNADVQVVPLSVTSGEGFEAWRDWLRASQPAPA